MTFTSAGERVKGYSVTTIIPFYLFKFLKIIMFWLFILITNMKINNSKQWFHYKKIGSGALTG